jgi:putative transcriptional regulator
VLRNSVKRTREELGLSQRELGRKTGLSRQTLSAIEQDDGYSPNASVMAAVAEALDAKLGDLFWLDSEDRSEAIA